jgi:hypothetical protein
MVLGFWVDDDFNRFLVLRFSVAAGPRFGNRSTSITAMGMFR